MTPVHEPISGAWRSRARLDELELAHLAPYAERSATSRGRRYPATPHEYRSEFQKDRDRIMYTTAFRRLQYKTQVFITHEGDYYRTRLTHTTEAAQIARTVARVLSVNEDLAEAITLAHDLGHSPFGHSGEATLDRLMLVAAGMDPNDPAHRGRGFNHTVQSLRVVETLERRWPEHPGLNLTWESREGLAKHDTEYDSVGPDWRADFLPAFLPSLEAQIVNFADELTYTAHDLDDGLRSGMLAEYGDELEELAIWRAASSGVGVADPELRRHRVVRRVIDHLITDLVLTSAERIAAASPASPDEARASGAPLIALSGETAEALSELKAFLFRRLYRHTRVVRMYHKAERVLSDLFGAFESDYRQLPREPRSMVAAAQSDAGPGDPLSPTAYRAIADYLAGMTDRYALQEHQRLFDPVARA
jgi:dGTPase